MTTHEQAVERLERDLLAFKDKQLGSIRISVDEVRTILDLIAQARALSSGGVGEAR